MMYKACLIHVACLFEQGLDLRIIQQLRKKQRGMALCETVAPCLTRHKSERRDKRRAPAERIYIAWRHYCIKDGGLYDEPLATEQEKDGDSERRSLSGEGAASR